MLATVYTLLVAVCGWVLFDLPSIGAAAAYYRSMFGFARGGFSSANDFFYLREYATVFIVCIIACLPLGKKLYDRLSGRSKAWLTPVMIAAVLILSTAYLVNATYNPFLYFRF